MVVFASSINMQAYSQVKSDTNKLILGKIEPYLMEVAFNKTSHLIFPAGIRYVDLGSEWLVASKAEDAENVLRVKAAIKDFKEETNFSVITNDGKFYNFNVQFNTSPMTLNYDLMQMQKSKDRENRQDVLLEELGDNSPSMTDLLMQSIYSRNKRMIRHISAESYGIVFRLKGMYIHNGLYYFNTELKNNSNIPYNIDFVNFKVIDRKLAKRTVLQEKKLIPLRIFKPLDSIPENAMDQNIFVLDQFTLTDGKRLVIEIFEKNGGRHQVLKLENSDLVNARRIKDLHLKFGSSE